MTLWHWNDFKVKDVDTATCGHCDFLPGVYPPTCTHIEPETKTCNGRPGGKNHKGVVDFWRRPKEAFHVVKKLYTDYQRAHEHPQGGEGRAARA